PESSVVRMLNKPDTTIYLPPGSPWPPELHADRVRLGIIRVMVIAGMAGGDQLNGFGCIGPPHAERQSYKFEELRFINNLVGQLAIAVERAQVISSLERRVRELDVLSQVSQAVNFTIEFDDLLELISAQAARLILSPYFYIVLYDPAAEQLYYAFFLENDERISEKENRRWSPGRDLYSDIIQTGKPLLVDDYARTMSQNGYPIIHESPHTRAWMGVPLLAGTRTLGVLAAGDDDPDHTYSSEQLRIFSDIGSLAATSLEKARLFTETNARARQLAALNDISRQLVASEGDVERLLKLITSSAVDILNAEAGSLLLTTDDSASGLEYRAAVNAGEDLIGTRLADPDDPVSQVARSGQPMIVNGQTSPDGRPGRHDDTGIVAHSMLGAPLIVQERVIGVLEVVNRRDGTVYTQDDIEMLTTLAGQAAIALENARLFQQTDLQLTRRVQELEALERIDVEMNRTLDLAHVAEITTRWAVTNSNATAGLLGIISEDKRQLMIIHRQGYPDDSEPGEVWSLDEGIVRRVMRTRRPDLQPYVAMDPDYVPSLPDALSQITVPMLSGDDINALLVLESDREPRLNLLDLDWAQRLAEHAAIAIANAQLYAELTRANESKSEFVGFAAHELKNPLSSVRGYADLLRSGMTGTVSDQQKDFLNIIRSNADRMQVIIEDLRDIARIDAQQLRIVPVPVNFREVVDETLRPFQQPISDKGQHLVNNVDGDLPQVLGDKVRLIQVMTNFVSNAHKYSPAEATITVDARVIENERDPQSGRTGPALHISIADTGIGLSDEDLQQLFRVRYFRSSNQQAQDQPGTGLGMMITQHLVEQHGGRLWVESELGSGSTFHFTVPLAPQNEPAT
ncbi:MAG: GAF domain-containing protein, partial [Phototrophicaceae bacterium]